MPGNNAEKKAGGSDQKNYCIFCPVIAVSFETSERYNKINLNNV